jgi:hypothetical protein
MCVCNSPFLFRTHNLLWNKLATPQDTHDQESNAPSVPLWSTS